MAEQNGFGRGVLVTLAVVLVLVAALFVGYQFGAAGGGGSEGSTDLGQLRYTLDKIDQQVKDNGELLEDIDRRLTRIIGSPGSPKEVK